MTRPDTRYAEARFRATDARHNAVKDPTAAILDLANGLEVLVQAILTERREQTPDAGGPTRETSRNTPPPPMTYVLMCVEPYCGRLFEWKGEASSHDDALRQAVAAARAEGWEVTQTHDGVKAACQGKSPRIQSAYDDGVQAERERILKVIAVERAKVTDQQMTMSAAEASRGSSSWAPYAKANAVLRSVERGIRGERWFWNEGPGANREAFRREFRRLAQAGTVSHESPSGHGWYGPTDPVRREQAYQEALAAQRARIQAEADACGDTFVTVKDGKITPLEDPKPPVGGDWNLLTGRDALAALNITPNTDDGPNGARLYRDEPTWLRRALMWLAGR